MPVEYLLLVNSQDDNKNGWVDEGYDGVDNNADGQIDEIGEWETESWAGSVLTPSGVDLPYVVRRRPAPGPGSREVALPTAVVVDATTSLLTRERSRLPINRYAGYADIVLNPDGTVMPGSIYSSPSTFGMADAFYHFWLAERADLADAPAGATTDSAAPLLPISGPGGADAGSYVGPRLQGSYGLLTLFSRTGQIVVNEAMPFDDPVVATSDGRPFNSNRPFIASQEGATGS
jgi:hypothetical protein